MNTPIETTQNTAGREALAAGKRLVKPTRRVIAVGRSVFVAQSGTRANYLRVAR